jgi:hypothetical protein
VRHLIFWVSVAIIFSDCAVVTWAAVTLLKSLAISGLERDDRQKLGFESEQLKVWHFQDPSLIPQRTYVIKAVNRAGPGWQGPRD